MDIDSWVKEAENVLREISKAIGVDVSAGDTMPLTENLTALVYGLVIFTRMLILCIIWN